MPEYPGLGLPLRYHNQDEFPFYPIGAHQDSWGAQSFILPVRELAMMSVMERLTDKENWHKKVFDEEIVAKWRNEALGVPDKEWWHMAIEAKSTAYLDDGTVQYRNEWGWDGDVDPELPLESIMNDTTFDFCVRELQMKAKYYEATGLIPTLDACASAVKSDTLVSQDLKVSLGRAFDKLKKDQANCPDWHPNTNNIVQDLVHPSMYPLVYSRSRIIKEETVGVEDAIEKWAGKGEVISKDTEEVNDGYSQGVPPRFWSDTYQWLPANLAFQDDGSVELTSYINNLHPNKYPEIYRTIEKLIETALPAWDQCLAICTSYHDTEGAGRTLSRFSKPENPDDDNDENWTPSDRKEAANIKIEDLNLDKEAKEEYERMKKDTEYTTEDDITDFKYKQFRKPRIPDPDNEVLSYAPEHGKRLFDRFKSSGLQVIVKLASIELTPEQPDFPVGGWHVEGQMNEHICGTALYYLDSENISESSLAFRMQTSSYLDDDIEVGQDAYHWLERVYGTHLGNRNSPALQNYGRVVTKEGRLLAFPNVFQHRVSPFSLLDKTKPGHRRFIALWLVDPTRRIISTANVPPQQQSWWAEAILGSDPAARKEALSKLPAELVALLAEKGLDSETADLKDAKLPPELMEMVRRHFEVGKEALPMSEEEAREHRLKLMEVRSAHVKQSEEAWQEHAYSFCEH